MSQIYRQRSVWNHRGVAKHQKIFVLLASEMLKMRTVNLKRQGLFEHLVVG